MTVRILRAFRADARGATAVEYALLAALISLTLIGGATLIGVNENNLFLRIGNAFSQS